ncbi:unnamed protein product [Lampetra fluviatilis]
MWVWYRLKRVTANADRQRWVAPRPVCSADPYREGCDSPGHGNGLANKSRGAPVDPIELDVTGSVYAEAPSEVGGWVGGHVVGGRDPSGGFWKAVLAQGGAGRLRGGYKPESPTSARGVCAASPPGGASSPVHEGCVNSLCWSERGDLLLSGSDDTKLVLTNPFTRKVVASVPSGSQGQHFLGALPAVERRAGSRVVCR